MNDHLTSSPGFGALRTRTLYRLLSSAVLLFFGLIGLGEAGAQGQIYVNDDSPSASPDGASWATAFKDLQQAIDLWGTLPQPRPQIWVATGTYYPTRDETGASVFPGDRTATFLLPDTVELYGGFVGNETMLANRAGAFSQTVLSGDHPALGISYHVVTSKQGALLGNDWTILDGFMIRYGKADESSYDYRGGGIWCHGSNILIDNCTIEDCFALEGGGIYMESTNFGITRCRLRNNVAEVSGGGLRATGRNQQSWIYNTHVQANRAPDGGGIQLLSSGFFDNPIFLANLLVYDNVALRGGGALVEPLAFARWHNCTIAFNTAVPDPNPPAQPDPSQDSGFGGGVLDLNPPGTMGGGNYTEYWNTIAWANGSGFLGNSPDIEFANPAGGTAVIGPIQFSDLQYLTSGTPYPGTGNLNVKPEFVSHVNRDLKLQPTSPVIDAASSNLPPDFPDLDQNGATTVLPLDVRNALRSIDLISGGAIVDMGAYEMF